MFFKNTAFLVIVILIITIIIIVFINKEKYVNATDTDISIINFNCLASPSVPLNTNGPADIQCTSGDNPICLDHILFRSSSQYV